MSKLGRNKMDSDCERMDTESKEIQEQLESRTSDVENVAEVFEQIMEGGTEEGFQAMMDRVLGAHTTGGEKFDETNDALEDQTQEVQENEQEVKESSDEVNENHDKLREVECNLEGLEVKDEVQNAEQAAMEDSDFLKDGQEQLRKISEQSEQMAEELGRRAQAAKAKGGR